MSGWLEVKLGQVAEFINGDRGKNYPSEGDFVDQGIPFINAGHLTNGKVVFSNMNYISESRFRLLGSGKTRMNDILYCLRGSLGKTAIVRQRDDAAIASSLVIIRPSSDCSVEYLYHFLTSPAAKSELHKFDNGSSQPNLSANSVKNYVLPLPPLAEQRRIAEVLDRTEALRAKRRAALAQLDTLTQSIFLDLFGDPVQNPRGFPVKPMIDLVDPERPISYGILMPGPDQEKGVKYVRVVDMKDGGIDLSGIRKTTEKISNEFRRSLLKPADLLMSIRGHVGRFAVVPPELDRANITQDTARLAIRGASSIFVRECLRTLGFQRWMAKHTKGVAVRGINLGDVKRMPMILPPREDQEDFSRHAIAIEKLRNTHRASLTELDALFAVLQQRAFRGEL